MKRQQQIAEIFAAAIQEEPLEQLNFLADECGGDAELFAEIKALLDAYQQAETNDFLEDSAFEIEAESLAGETDSRVGQTVGHYKIIEKIGAGGMGAVYLARRDDGEFEQTVAVKFIRGGFDTKEIVRRFRNERRILAALNHPFIARLIDGGTSADDSPYIVMEAVEGVPVDEFVERENLSLEEKLNLFRKICAAVAYAHRNLIVHRDLKPSNILITADGEPKLLDFGIAKLFSSDDAETQTRTDFRALTPEYASPEQMRGEPLTTATDVYSLGVILYELLARTRPFKTEGKKFAEVFQLISEVEPIKPSDAISMESLRRTDAEIKNRAEKLESETRITDFKIQKATDNELQTANNEQKKLNPKSQIPNSKSLKGDLDNIVLKALRKEPARRYSSVESFSDDVRRYLEGLPISARPDTFSYRAGKFIQRNRAAAAVSILLIAALLGGAAATVYQWRVARIERAKAEARFEILRKSSRSMVTEIHAAMMNLQGSLEARKLLLQRAVEQLDALAADAENNPPLQQDLADAYQNIGYLPDKPIAEREEIFNKSIAFYEKILARNPQSVEARRGLAMSKVNLADFARLRGANDEALKYNRESVALLEAVVADAPEDTENKIDLWNVSYNAALTLTQTGHAAEALEFCRKILPLAVEIKERNPTDKDDNMFRRPYLTRGLASNNLIFLGRYDEAVTEIRAALEDVSKTRVELPNGEYERLDESVFNHRLAIALERGGKLDEAIAAMRKSLDETENLAKIDGKNTLYQTSAAQENSQFGHLLTRAGKASEAVSFFNRAIEIDERTVAADAQQKQVKADLAYAYAGRGNALAQTGKQAQGLADERRAVALFEEIGAADSSAAPTLHDYAETLFDLGETLLRDKKSDEAREAFAKSLAVWTKMRTRGILNSFDANQPEKIQNRMRQIPNANQSV